MIHRRRARPLPVDRQTKLAEHLRTVPPVVEVPTVVEFVSMAELVLDVEWWWSW